MRCNECNSLNMSVSYILPLPIKTTGMDIKKPTLGLGEYSPIEVASAMHSFAIDMQSYYKINHGKLIDQLDEATDEETLTKLKGQLKEVSQKMEHFTVLSNASCIVSTLLHSSLAVTEFRKA